jgi:predicted Zn-dependent protease
VLTPPTFRRSRTLSASAGLGGSRSFFFAGLALVALFAAMALPAPGTVAAQSVSLSGGIGGYVRDAGTHDPVVSARVDLMSPNGLAAPTTYTNENGQFRFGYLRDGDYQIVVSKMGYEKTEVTMSVVAGHSTAINIDLSAARSQFSSAEESGPPAIVSAHELSAPAAARGDYAKGKELMAKSNYDGAMAAFQRAIHEFADFYEAYASMGVAQYMSGHAAEARASLQKSIGLSRGQYPDALFDLADVYNDVGNYADAEPLAKQVINLDASSWHGYFERARALLGLKRYADAEQNAEKCIQLDPRNLQAGVILTNIHIAMHDYQAALQDIDAYLKLDPSSSASDAMRSTRAQLAKALADAKKKSEPGPK